MYTVKECKEMIEAYKQAELAVLQGKRYRIGARELERADLKDIVHFRGLWEIRLQKLEKKKKRVTRVGVPRDW